MHGSFDLTESEVQNKVIELWVADDGRCTGRNVETSIPVYVVK